MKIFDQCLFLQLMLSASILKSIFEFQTWIPNVYDKLKTVALYVSNTLVITGCNTIKNFEKMLSSKILL